MITGSAHGPAALVVLGAIALFGNGLKAIVTSTVLVSEAQFATLVGVPVERVALLMEAIVAGMVVALAVYPLLLHRFSVRAVALGACFTAAAAFAAFAAVDFVRPAQRALNAYVLLTVGAAALACLAPAAQALVTQWPSAVGRKVLTTLWTGATPAGFLIAPQLAKWFLPALGLSAYFLAFAALPLVALALVAAVGAVLPAMRAGERPADTFPVAVIVAFVAAVAAFEVWSTAGSVAGYLTPAALGGLALMIAAFAWLGSRAARLRQERGASAATYWLLAALFALEMPTTGFFEAAFLFAHRMPPAFVADRAMLAAAAQIVGTLAAGLLVHRAQGVAPSLLAAFAGIALAGLASYAWYPWSARPEYFLATAALTGVGAGGLTVLLCVAIVRDADRIPMLAALPSIAIMIGTEFGLELLSLVLAAAHASGPTADGAFSALFVAQVACGAAVPALLWAATRQQTG